MRKKQDPISLPKRIVLGASLILASTYTVAWAGNTQNETPHHHAIESITQVKTVTGVVTDQYGPVIGANVHVKGSTTGTITDIDGKFSIEVPVNSVLEISYPERCRLCGYLRFTGGQWCYLNYHQARQGGKYPYRL